MADLNDAVRRRDALEFALKWPPNASPDRASNVLEEAEKYLAFLNGGCDDPRA